MRRLFFAVLALPLLLGACGDTFRGAKEDTQENIDATRRAL